MASFRGEDPRGCRTTWRETFAGAAHWKGATDEVGTFQFLAIVHGRSWKVGADRCAEVVPRPANGRAEPRVRALRERRHNVGEDETVGTGILCQPSSDTVGCATWTSEYTTFIRKATCILSSGGTIQIGGWEESYRQAGKSCSVFRVRVVRDVSGVRSCVR